MALLHREGQIPQEHRLKVTARIYHSHILIKTSDKQIFTANLGSDNHWTNPKPDVYGIFSCHAYLYLL